MAWDDGTSAVAVDPPGTQHRLAGGALGLPGVIFCIVTGAAPMTAMLFNVPVAVMGSGYGAPAAFLLATVALTVFSVGYIAMSRRVTSAGGFYTFVTRGLGRIPGVGSGVLIALCYMLFSASVLGVMGYFAATGIESWTGADIPAWVYMIAALAAMTVLAWFHIELTTRILGVSLVLEVLALVILSVGVLVHGGAHGLSARPVNPAEVFGNDGAAHVFGSGAAGVALFAAFWSWVGFEMAPNYAEESRDPHRIARAATYGSVIGLGLLYMLVSYAFVSGWGLTGSAQAVKDQFTGRYDSAFYPLAETFVGHWLLVMMQVLAIVSPFACAMAFYNTGARYLFSLAREGVAPAALARTSRHHSPAAASMTVTVLVGLLVLGFTLHDSSTEGSLLELGTWAPLMGVLGILGVQGLTSFAIIRYFLTTARDGFHWFTTLVAPLVGAGAMAGACWLLVKNRAVLAGDGDVPFIRYLPEAVVVMFALGVAVALWMRARRPVHYELLGHFDLTDPAGAGQPVAEPSSTGLG
ncbi:APC family permease [Actinacidiphila sp. ITFR-21]|uniref:APC family permease n=1 Tax=Actinacidiphila sp. ITFR-21 TaxID=3075199 RepID=UPI00288C2B65|nr:APC family permease [Streptomyces sp. ITFR-21]WNI19460.1 APC family permease [Streptomyces sp. ITFR-21]